MNARNILIALGAGLIVTGTLYLTGFGETGHTYQALAIADCAQAKIDDKTGLNVACQSGEVVARIKWTGEIPQGYELLEPPTEITNEELPAPVPQPLASDCIAGAVMRDTSEHLDGSQWRIWKEHHVCCGERCECMDPKGCAVAPPIEMAGRETWRARLAEARPDLGP